MFKFKPSPQAKRNIAKIKKMDLIITEGITQGFYNIGRKIRPDIISSIVDDKKTGRIYKTRLNGRQVTHQASAPGEPPANFSGMLKRTVGYKIRKSGRNMEIGAGSRRVPYARGLELGTSRVAPRPYIKPKIESNNKDIQEFIEDAIRKELKKS